MIRIASGSAAHAHNQHAAEQLYGRDFMERSSAIMHVLATAAQVDPDAAQLLEDIRRQRHTGQSSIAAALAARGALDPELQFSDAADIAYAVLSPDVYRILTTERGWTAAQYERWLVRSLGLLLRREPLAIRDAGQ